MDEEIYTEGSEEGRGSVDLMWMKMSMREAVWWS